MTQDDDMNEASLKKPATAARVSSTGRPPVSPPRNSNPTSPLTVPTLETNTHEIGRGHQRKVSWGGGVAIPAPASPPNTSSRPTITQQDLAEQIPTENEAEARLVNSLDNIDPTTAPRSQLSVLSNLTDTDLQAMQPLQSERTSSEGSKGWKAAMTAARTTARLGSRQKTARLNKEGGAGVPATRGGHSRKPTVGDRLEGLAAAMDAVNLAHLDMLDLDMTEPPVMDIPDRTPHESLSSADAFHRNTNLLFQRHASRRSGLRDEDVAAAADDSPATAAPPYLSSTPAEIQAKQGASAEKRWKMLKHAVTTTNMVNSANQEVAEHNNHDPSDIDPEVATGKDGKEKLDTVDEVEASEEKGNKGKRNSQWRRKRKAQAANALRDLKDFAAPQNETYRLFKIAILFVALPATGIAAILFYFGGNPPTGIVDLKRSANGTLYNEKGDVISDDTASASWWLLFLGVRQVSVALLAKFFEVLFIDVLAVRSRFSVKVLGPWATLFLLQTKGWPFMLFAWGLLSLCLLSGTKPFFHHWGYWQDYIDLFNESNPSGQVVQSAANHRVTAIAIAVGAIMSFKRFWLGLHLGRQTFAQFSDRLAAVMKKILLVSEVASLGRAFERHNIIHKGSQTSKHASATHYGFNQSKLQGLMSAPEDESQGYAQDAFDTTEAKFVIDPHDRHPLTGQLSLTQKGRILTLLGQWTEPTLAEKVETQATVNEILQFRRALEYLRTPYPFSGSFGLADSRESVIESAQKVYDRLLLRSPDPDTIHFDVIALLGVNRDGGLDSHKLKDLIKLFRPERDGTMECVHFVKSVDEVYKELRLLRASVANSSKIDRAFERIFNVLFYTILGCLILSNLGYDPLALFLSISGAVVAFAFMIGSASAKYFEGILFILARRPYQIGDAIALSGVNEETPSTGSHNWIVEDVDLFTTKLVFSFTGEKATISNGAMAASRVINATSSKEALLFVLVKFPIEVSFDKLQVFREQLTEFFKNRPREWIAFTRFRPTRFEINEGYVEYIICGQHRLPWSKYGDLMQSKADLMHFCMELQRSMKLVFHQPPQPVDVNIRNGEKFLGQDISQSLFQAPPSPGGGSFVADDKPKFLALQSMFAPKSD